MHFVGYPVFALHDELQRMYGKLFLGLLENLDGDVAFLGLGVAKRGI